MVTIIHSGHERDALGPVAVFEVLLDAGVQVPDAAAGLDDGLALDLQDEPQHSVGGGVLRPHVDHDPLAGMLLGSRHYLFPVLSADNDDRVGAAAVLGRSRRSTHQL